MRLSLFEQLLRIYRDGVRISWIVCGLSIGGLLAQVCSRVAPNALCAQLGGAAQFLVISTIIGGFLGLASMLWARNRSRDLLKLEENDPDSANHAYQRIWQFQRTAGGLVTVASIAMIPLAIPSLLLGLSGLAVVLALFGGSWLHMRARKLNRSIAQGLAVEPEQAKLFGDSKIIRESTAGLVPLLIANLLLAINVVTENYFIDNLRSIPTFYHNPSVTNAGVSLSQGFAGFFDVAAFGTIGVAMLVYAIKIRARMPARRLWVISVATALQLIIIPGVTSPIIAKTLGPNEVGAMALKNWDASAVTMQLIDTQPWPQMFRVQGVGDVQEEVNARRIAQSEASTNPDFESTCSAVIDFATRLGAENWLEKTSNTTGKVADSVGTQKACLRAVQGYPRLKIQRNTVNSPEFILAGRYERSGGRASPIALKLTLLKQGDSGDAAHTWIYELQVATTYGEDPMTLTGGLSKGTIEIEDLLTLFGQERLSAPERNPTDLAFVEEILKSYKHRIPIRIFETKPGVANRLELTNSDGAHMCLSIDPWDVTASGMEDQGFGYGLGFVDKLEVLKGFGVAVDGSCQK